VNLVSSHRAAAHSLVVPSLAIYRHVWQHAAGMRGRYVLALALLTGSQVVKLLVPWLAAQAIDTVQLADNDQLGKAAFLTAGIFLVYAAAWAMHGPGRVLERRVGLHVRASLADALYAKLAVLPLSWHDANHSGDVQQRAQLASKALGDFTESQFVYLQNLVNVIGPLCALTLVWWGTGALAACGFVGVALVIIRFDRALMRLATEENRYERAYTVRLLDFLGNISTVLSLRLEAVSRRLVGQRLDQVFVPRRRAITLNEKKWCAVDLLTVGLSWTLVTVYAWRAHGGGGPLLLGGIFMVYQYAQQAGNVIGSMAANLQTLTRVKTDFASAAPIFAAPERAASNAAARSDWRRIRARGLEFTYTRSDGARGGIREVTLTLERGDRIAVIGPSGSGKSTLLRVIAGLYEPQHGYYEVDGETVFGLRHLASVATLIPQETEIFEASVRDNVTFATEATPDALERAAHLAAFDAVRQALPQGWDTVVLERGTNLSGGQRQRLALARGLLAARDSSLLLLDEPTSALDQATEATVFQRLRNGLPDTCLVASVHRMSALGHFDKVVLMCDGRVADAGPVAQVLERQAGLRDMVLAGSHGSLANARTGESRAS
jgi:ATP-binding cassette, subfamily B, bacterial